MMGPIFSSQVVCMSCRWMLCRWLLVGGWVGAALAAPFSPTDPLGICPLDPLAALLVANPPPVTDGPMELTADQGDADDATARLQGNVRFEQNGQRITADRAQLDRQTDILTATGQVVFADAATAATAERGDLDLLNRRGTLEGVRYYVGGTGAQGEAETASFDQERRQSQFQNMTYSTCERANEFWQLTAGELTLDEAKAEGVAKNATLRIRQVPVLYAPYLSFPLDDRRKSGFLPPRIGLSNANGLDLRLPYYWNLAPNYDATLTPRYISKRGVMAGAEFRFLQPNQSGEVEGEYLPNDRLRNEDRGAFFLTHRSNLFPNFFTDAVFRYVSDDDYVDDLGTGFQLVNPVALERRFDARYDGGHWQLLGRFQSFQTIDRILFQDRETPYDRVPQILFEGRFPIAGNNQFNLRQEAVYFDHAELTRGLRLDFHPSVELPLTAPYGFFTPRLGLRHTFYDLHGYPTPSASDDDPQGNTARTLPIISADTGLIFEKSTADGLFGATRQTLEPRLFYLYVPYKNQRRLPLFDTTKFDNNYALLFAENRFTGADRVGDANQLTVALTSRLISADTGQERLRISTGQIQYFANRRVFLTDRPADTDKRSDLITEVAFTPDAPYSLLSAVHWDPGSNQFPRRSFSLRYSPDNRRLLNAAYYAAPRDIDDEDSRRLEQIDLSFAWPLGGQWRTVGRWNYSLSQERSVDVLAGVEYQDCCWATRLVARRYREKPQDADARNEVYLEVELKGLAGVGNRIDRLLQDAILGYQPTHRGL